MLVIPEFPPAQNLVSFAPLENFLSAFSAALKTQFEVYNEAENDRNRRMDELSREVSSLREALQDAHVRHESDSKRIESLSQRVTTTEDYLRKLDCVSKTQLSETMNEVHEEVNRVSQKAYSDTSALGERMKLSLDDVYTNISRVDHSLQQSKDTIETFRKTMDLQNDRIERTLTDAERKSHERTEKIAETAQKKEKQNLEIREETRQERLQLSNLVHDIEKDITNMTEQLRRTIMEKMENVKDGSEDLSKRLYSLSSDFKSFQIQHQEIHRDLDRSVLGLLFTLDLRKSDVHELYINESPIPERLDVLNHTSLVADLRQQLDLKVPFSELREFREKMQRVDDTVVEFRSALDTKFDEDVKQMTKIRHDVESLSLQTNELQVSKVDDSKLQSVIDQLEAILSSKVDNSTLSEQYVNLSKLEDELNSARKAMYAELDQRIDPETGERIRALIEGFDNFLQQIDYLHEEKANRDEFDALSEEVHELIRRTASAQKKCLSCEAPMPDLSDMNLEPPKNTNSFPPSALSPRAAMNQSRRSIESSMRLDAYYRWIDGHHEKGRKPSDIGESSPSNSSGPIPPVSTRGSSSQRSRPSPRR